MNEQDIIDIMVIMYESHKKHKKRLKKLRRAGRRLVEKWIKDGLVKLPNWNKFNKGG